VNSSPTSNGSERGLSILRLSFLLTPIIAASSIKVPVAWKELNFDLAAYHLVFAGTSRRCDFDRVDHTSHSLIRLEMKAPR
jgi:hypothetical protein